ncbi:hypothetical protein OnM2_064048 [Erysiphe neolycopersici]|uniref:Uncharacterized protein n=1 Tax=Erysiphe neolycopersici TaxID=212602 RepID=A0A420HNC0_9PEZI|nr:hypothetical protein OnM2_064048 [Erysiphe neolycopersici]
MGLIFKALFSISTARQDSKKTQGYSYDASVPLSPPIKGQHPLLGNGPKSLSSKAIQTAKAQRNKKRQITRSAGSTTDSSKTYIPETPQILHKIDTRSTSSTIPNNWKLDHRRRSWEKDTRWSRPTTSTSFVSSTLQRPTTGYIPANLKRKLHHRDSLPNVSNSLPKLYHVDLLDAHSSLRPSETLIRDRVQASGIRSYGEDVADRNMSPELPELLVERVEIPQESRPLIDSPELKFLKEMHLANKKAVGMTDNEPTLTSTPPTRNIENEKPHVYDNQVKKLSHPHSYSHPFRSLLGISNKAYQSAEISNESDRTRSYSLSKLSQLKPQPYKPFNDEVMPKDEVTLLKYPDSSVSPHNLAYSSPKSPKGHSSPGFKKNLDSPQKDQKSRRHTYSTAVYRRILPSPVETNFSFRQNQQLRPHSNGSATKGSNPNLNNNPFQNDPLELNQNNFSEGVSKDDNRADGKFTEKNQTANEKREGYETDDVPERNDLETSKLNHRDNCQRRCSLKQDSVKTLQRSQVPFSNTNKTEPKVDDVLSSNHLPDQSRLRQESPQLYLRHEIPPKSPYYSPAEAPTIRLDRNRSTDQVESIAFQEIQSISGTTKNDSADSPVILATREKAIVAEEPKNSNQKSTSLPSNLSNEILNHILPSKKDYIRNEASLGMQYVWHLRPLFDDNKLCSKSFSTDRCGTNKKRLSLSQSQYNSISENDGFCVSDQDLLSSKEDNMCLEDNFGFDFANVLPGLQMVESLPMTRSILSQNA